jgi:nicotinamide mononucleotide (NMN) deamidase PncC
MRKPATPAIATSKASLPSGSRHDTPAGLICLALALALFALAFRIASVW